MTAFEITYDSTLNHPAESALAPKPGTRAWIINRTLGGRYLVEGRARIVRRLGDGRYLVRFPEGTYERYVDPEAQADPYRYVRECNAFEAWKEAQAELGEQSLRERDALLAAIDEDQPDRATAPPCFRRDGCHRSQDCRLVHLCADDPAHEAALAQARRASR